MSGVTPDYDGNPAGEVYVARQPIFTSSRELYAYELLYRSSPVNAFDGEDSTVATSRVIANTYFAIGLDRLVGKHRSFINFDRQMLVGGEAESLAGPSVVIEILETVEPDEEVLDACRRIRTRGSLLALDDFVCADGFVPLLELADIVKVDIQAADPGEVAASVRAVPGVPRRLLAEKVESDAEFQRAIELGYSLFQGYFLGRPQVVASTKVPKRG